MKQLLTLIGVVGLCLMIGFVQVNAEDSSAGVRFESQAEEIEQRFQDQLSDKDSESLKKSQQILPQTGQETVNVLPFAGLSLIIMIFLSVTFKHVYVQNLHKKYINS